MERRSRRRILAFGLIGLGLAAPVAEFVQWSMWRQALQRHADAAAEDGAQALLAGEAVEERALAEIPGNLELAVPPSIQHPPRAGAYAGRPEAVRVVLKAVRRPLVSGRMLGPRTMTAKATAAIFRDGDGDVRSPRVE